MSKKRDVVKDTLPLPARMQVRRMARAAGRTQKTFERLARVYGVRVEVIRSTVIG